MAAASVVLEGLCIVTCVFMLIAAYPRQVAFLLALMLSLWIVWVLAVWFVGVMEWQHIFSAGHYDILSKLRMVTPSFLHHKEPCDPIIMAEAGHASSRRNNNIACVLRDRPEYAYIVEVAVQ